MAENPSAWLSKFVEAVSDCMEAHSAAGPVGWRVYEEDDDTVELLIYAMPVELMGGEYDGSIVLPGFSLDVQALQSLFERVTALDWKAQGFGPGDDVGPCLSLEGIYQGHVIWLRVLAEAPEDEEPGMQLATTASE